MRRSPMNEARPLMLMGTGFASPMGRKLAGKRSGGATHLSIQLTSDDCVPGTAESQQGERALRTQARADD